MRKFFSIITSLILLATSVAGQDKTYFVSTSGNDNADGLSVATAWKSLDKINATTFQPGDKILFKAGDTWYGQLFMKGSGSEGKPIILSSFGCGRPVINIGAAEGAGILIENQSWWEVYNFEVTSGAPPTVGIGRQGIVITADKPGEEFNHFVVKDCYVHDIWGQMGGNTKYCGYNSCAILVMVNRVRPAAGSTVVAAPARMNDVLIENNRIERFDKCGIISRGPRNNVVVRGNYMDNLGGDGIFVNGPYRGLIEYNEIHRSCMRSGYLDLPGDQNWWPHTAACWIQNTEETIMQYNEVYDTGREPKNGDGFAYDFDFNCVRCVAQYNYSKNNHGFLLLMYNIYENIARYNISENDRTHLVQMQGSRLGDRNLLYNNVFYVDYGTLDLDFFIGNSAEDGRDPDILGAYFFNNIFYATGQGRFRTAYSTGETISRKFDETIKPNIPSGSMFLHNCYFGPWKNGLPDDPEALVADPKFVAPGTGGTGIKTVGGYMLRPDSPCINTGMYVPLAGCKDYFGNCLTDGHPDFGAFEALGTGVFADKAALSAKDSEARDESMVKLAKWAFPAAIACDNPEKVSVRLSFPIEEGVTGTLTWTNPKNNKVTKIDLAKQTNRSSLEFKLKADLETVLASSIKVELKKGNYSESLDIPFTKVQPRRR